MTRRTGSLRERPPAAPPRAAPVPGVAPSPAVGPAEARWATVVERRTDDSFVYAVTTTRVFCRPTCPARLPRREHVEFFDSARQAASAGFRPCKRCRPDLARPDQDRERLVTDLCRWIDASETKPSLKTLAERAGMSPAHTLRLFKAVVGLTPAAYASARRAERLRKSLPESASVTEAIYRSGFGSAGRFYASASTALGMRPAVYRSGAASERIEFACATSTLGMVLVAATQRGICAVLLGDGSEQLEEDLRRRFPQAELAAAGPSFTKHLRAVVRAVERPQLAPELPLDVRGTVLQERVWRALREIPPGTTLTYGELARRLGAPRATRAVASACAANSVAVLIPCHRVVGADGSLRGYRWGLDRKQALLERERRGRKA